MTELESAKKNLITPLLKKIAAQEGIAAEALRKSLKSGKAVIPRNKNHAVKKPCAIGYGLRTKINANIGTSTDKSSIKEELKKLAQAIRYGADTVMDLSVGSRIDETRKEIIRNSSVPVGTVPIYEIAVKAANKKRNLLDFTINDILRTLQRQAEDGVDFFTLHCGVTKKSLEGLIKQKRVMGIVSRGGAIIATRIKKTGEENPFYEHFDAILELCHHYDITLSLGDGLRPGSILDSTDNAQISELMILGKLAERARERNVQVMIEGPGHVPLDEIKKNVELEKRICHGAPFYVLGPLVTDVAAGYDHITGAIGGALAASFGADFLCYVTPSEHLRHPSKEDVREGIIASRIAAHAADLVKLRHRAIIWDKKMSEARRKRDWSKQIRLSVDPERAMAFRASSRPRLPDVCTMCGKYCSIKLMQECLRV